MRIALVLLVLPLAGCGMIAGVQRIDSGLIYRQSQAKYRDCLQAAPNPHSCEREKLVMEADERAFTTTNAGYGGGAASVNADIKSR